MRKLLCFLLVAFTSATAFCQVEIKPADAAQHVGDSVTFTATIVSGRYLHSSKGGPTLLNVGAPYPNQLLTLVVWAEDRKNFEEAPEMAYVKKVVKVSGKVELFKEKPQIVVRTDKQIMIIPD
jgi:hypothetical protein